MCLLFIDLDKTIKGSCKLSNKVPKQNFLWYLSFTYCIIYAKQYRIYIFCTSIYSIKRNNKHICHVMSNTV